MTPTLEDVHAKVDRANEHIRKFAVLVSETYNAPASIRRDYDPESGKIMFRLNGDLPPVPLRLKILCGEALYQLRSALDYLVGAASTAEGKARKKLEFPIFCDAERYRKAAGDRLKDVPELIRAFIENQQPYHRGGAYHTHPLWNLHDLNNTDKHRFLIRVMVEGSPPMLGFNEPGTPPVEFFSGFKDGDILATVQTTDRELDVHVQPNIGVYMDDRFTEAADFLVRLSRTVSEIVHGISQCIEKQSLNC